MKYIVITGGVLSGIGKGTIASSLCHILTNSGVKVTALKIDPYLNYDAGTMNPYQHGEVFVLDDGSEVDLDLGNYERYLDRSLTGNNNITTGKVYKEAKIRFAIEYSKTLDFKSTVILIGSYARGDFNLWSDVDLLIIGDFTGNPVRRLEKIDFPAGYELILLTPEEISIMKEKKNKFLSDSFAEGVVLRDDFQYFS